MTTYLPQEIIRKKRDKQPLSSEEIGFFVNEISQNRISEAQIAAFCMAVFFNGLTIDEQTALTLSMRDSGQCLRWQTTTPIVDKHSTGGIGDNVSLILAPLLAACGVYVPMIAGRGLGHTGGTIDKLESIPHFEAFPNAARMQKIVQHIGCAIVGQTDELAPADKRIYAVRDISATVESIALITASILSKKLAEGLDGLVMDIKVGNGAFMTDITQARALAHNIVRVANAAGCQTSALLTDMNQPLAASIGNVVEVAEAVQFLRGDDQNPRLKNVTFALATEALRHAQLAPDQGAALKIVQKALDSGAAAERFDRMIAAQSGVQDFCQHYARLLPQAAVQKPLFAPHAGTITAMNSREMGLAVIQLGGGRVRTDDRIDYCVGFSQILPIGSAVDEHTPLVMIHARDEYSWQRAANAYLAAVTIDDAVVAPLNCVYEIVRTENISS